MKQALKYSLKVWLTSCIVVPFVWAVGFTFVHAGSQPMTPLILLGVLFIIGATIVTSSVTWLVFFLCTASILKYSPTFNKIKILFIGEAVVVLTFGGFMKAFPGFDQKVYSLIMIFHCIVIGLGIWFYKLKPPQLEQPISLSNDVP